MTYRQIFRTADLEAKKAIYAALQIAKGKAKAPGEVRPAQTGWAALMTMEKK